MARVKRGVTKHARHRKFVKMASGYRGRANSAYAIARMRVEKGLQYAYRDRRNRKRAFRRLWIQRINAGARLHGLTYGEFMHGLTKAGIELDRKVLADIAARDPGGFEALTTAVREAIAKS